MGDFREGKSIGTSDTSDIKCSSYTQAKKVFYATIYPEIGDNVYYYNEYIKGYSIGTVIKYNSVVSLTLEGFAGEQIKYSLVKNGYWKQIRDKGIYNVFDIKYDLPLKENME